MFIAAITERGSAGDGYTVRLSEGSSFFVSADFLNSRSYYEGLEIGEDQFELLEEESGRISALFKAGELLARAEQSSGGLLQKLIKKGFSENSAALAVERVTELKLLDDRRYAEIWINSRLRQHPEGRNALYQGLLSRGVAPEAARNALDEILKEEMLHEAVMKAGRKIELRTKGDEIKVKQALYRRGFSTSEIHFYFSRRGI